MLHLVGTKANSSSRTPEAATARTVVFLDSALLPLGTEERRQALLLLRSHLDARAESLQDASGPDVA
jgi:hypothetical protein